MNPVKERNDMTMIRRALIALVVLGLCFSARAEIYSYNFTNGFNNGGIIPDGNPSGFVDTRVVNLGLDFGPVSGTEILDVNVRLNIAGGFNGDLYGYLVHASGFSVLLNRVGRTSGNGFGYGDAGFDIVLDGQATIYDKDIHSYLVATPSPIFASGKLTGTWAEDGRNVDPASVLDLSSRTSLLSSFNSLDANGDWSLFLADLSVGEESTVVSWGLEITTVPEPHTWVLAILTALGLIRFRNRR